LVEEEQVVIAALLFALEQEQLGQIYHLARNFRAITS
jgi:hypothetical protein